MKNILLFFLIKKKTAQLNKDSQDTKIHSTQKVITQANMTNRKKSSKPLRRSSSLNGQWLILKLPLLAKSIQKDVIAISPNVWIIIVFVVKKAINALKIANALIAKISKSLRSMRRTKRELWNSNQILSH